MGSLTVPATGSLCISSLHTHSEQASLTHTHITQAHSHQQTYGVLLLPPALDSQPAVRWVEGVYVLCYIVRLCIYVWLCVCMYVCLQMCLQMCMLTSVTLHSPLQYNNRSLIVSSTFTHSKATGNFETAAFQLYFKAVLQKAICFVAFFIVF